MNNRIEIIAETKQRHEDNPAQTRQLPSATAGAEVRRSLQKGYIAKLDDFLDREVFHNLEKNHQVTFTDFK